MDKLKNFIEDNRSAFDDEMLPKGHLERFGRKLPEPRGKRIRLYSLCGFTVAASIALLFLFRLPGGTHIPDIPQEATAQVCETKEEIDELRLYYNMQMNDILSRMEALYKKERTPGAAGLLKETRQVLTDNYMFETTVLPTLPCSNDGLFAMSQHYSNSLESLSFMLRQMEKVTDKQNDTNN